MKKCIKGIKLRIRELPLFYLIFSSYVVLFFLILLIFSYFSYQNSNKISIDNTNKYMFQLQNELSSQISTQIQTAVNVAFDLSSNDQLIDLLEKFEKASTISQLNYKYEIRDIINNYWLFNPQISRINIFVKNNLVQDISNQGLFSMDKVSVLPWFKQLFKGPGVFLDTYKNYLVKSQAEFSHFSSIIVKIDDPKDKNIKRSNKKINGVIHEDYDKLLAVISVDINETYFYDQLLRKNKASKNSKISIVNKKNIVISNEDKALIGKLSEYKDILEKATNVNASGLKSVKIAGERYTLIYTALNANDLRVIQLIPQADIYKGGAEIFKSIIKMALLLFLISFPLIILLSRLISKPIKKLSLTMKKVKDVGMVEIKKSYFGREIGELYDDYNYMVRRIENLIKDIEEGNRVQRQTEIKALQAQINPHFLYNTLDSINWMALNYNAMDISLMVTKLSRLFRLSLNKGMSIYTVCNEIEHVSNYLEIQKIKLKDLFNYNFDIADNILNYFIPKLILQPIVENSILHGFDTITSGGMIQITARLDKDNNNLIIDIIDNGVGISREKVESILTKNSRVEGYGIKNINERIKYICGEEYGLAYVFDRDKGTHVQLSLPIVEEPRRLNAG